MLTIAPLDGSCVAVSTRDAHEIERPKSVDGDGVDDARARSNSFSTEHSDRSDRDVFAARLDDDRLRTPSAVPAPYDARAGDPTRSGKTIQNFPARPSPALAALCASRARDAAPDGPELHACACAEMLARERELFGRFVLDVARAHHAPYRGQLVEWILDVCAGERFAPTTADVAIAFTVRPRRVDRFARSISPSIEQRTRPRDGCHQPSDRWVDGLDALFFLVCVYTEYGVFQCPSSHRASTWTTTTLHVSELFFIPRRKQFYSRGSTPARRVNGD